MLNDVFNMVKHSLKLCVSVVVEDCVCIYSTTQVIVEGVTVFTVHAVSRNVNLPSLAELRVILSSWVWFLCVFS